MARAQLQIDLVWAYQRYTSEIQHEIFDAQNRIAQEMLQEVIDTSPVREQSQRIADRPTRREPRQPGRYKSGWKLKKVEKRARYIIMAYNATDYQLTHLIDLGHRTHNDGYYRGNKHISKAQDKANGKLRAEIERILR